MRVLRDPNSWETMEPLLDEPRGASVLKLVLGEEPEAVPPAIGEWSSPGRGEG